MIKEYMGTAHNLQKRQRGMNKSFMQVNVWYVRLM